MTKISRIQCAVAIRDAALAVFARAQESEPAGSAAVLWIEYRGLKLALRTPFQRVGHITPARRRRILALCALYNIEPKFNLPYGLDIWTAEQKVLNIEWSHRDEIDLVSFKRGAWEKRMIPATRYAGV